MIYRNIYFLDDTHRGYFLYTSDSRRFGLVIEHQCVDGPVEEVLPLREKGYELVSEEPLTLTPYIFCDECGDYGEITEGNWIPRKAHV